MIKIDKKQVKGNNNILFYVKGSDTLNILSDAMQKYVKQQFANSKSFDTVSVTDSINNKVEKYIVVYFENAKVVTNKLLNKVFAKLIKGNTVDTNVLLDTLDCKLSTQEVAKQFTLDCLYYSYNFDKFKTGKKTTKAEYTLVTKEDITVSVDEAKVVANAIDTTRDLINTPVNYLNTYELCDFVTELVKDLENTSLEILDEKQCEELKMGAFLGVNKGSLQKARMITLKYQGKETFDNPIGLVGKGVMFDTGGYSIKLNMGTMKCDMGGAATVIGIFEAVAKLKLPINLIVMVAATDNRINEHAIVVDDILTSMKGKTIEIGSTDAEGRLTLCDALTYIQTMGCTEIIDMATLTGAVVAALGSYVTGVFTNDKKMVNQLIDSAKEVNSDFWELPITDHIRENVRKSKVADLLNRATPGASAAAAFLEEFIEEGTKWVHVDIAGTSFNNAPSYLEPAGATGVGVKEVLTYLMKK